MIDGVLPHHVDAFIHYKKVAGQSKKELQEFLFKTIWLKLNHESAFFETYAGENPSPPLFNLPIQIRLTFQSIQFPVERNRIRK